MNARVLGGMAGILLAALACSLLNPTAAPDQQPGVETIVAATIQAITDAAPTTAAEGSPVVITATLEQPVQAGGIPVSYQNVSFVIPEGVASGADVNVVPAATDDQSVAPWDLAPEHLVFSLKDWKTQDVVGLEPTILVFPAQEYAEINPGAGISLPLLQTLLADPSAPITLDTAPAVPYFNAGQIIIAQAARLNFASGSGVRTLTHYTQYYSPIVKNGQIYHFQGLTADGKYYVIAVLPILSPLQSTSENPSADGVLYPDINTSDEIAIENYYQVMTDKLDTASPDSFMPTLGQLDALIGSITIGSQ